MLQKACYIIAKYSAGNIGVANLLKYKDWLQLSGQSTPWHRARGGMQTSDSPSSGEKWSDGAEHVQWQHKKITAGIYLYMELF